MNGRLPAVLQGLSRRGLLLGAGSLAAGCAFGRLAGGSGPAFAGPADIGAPADSDGMVAALVAAERPRSLPCFGGQTLPLWTFADDTAFPVLRVKAGETLNARLENRLPRPGEHASIHWHGIRLPNNQDGVPYLTQPPVPPGEGYSYRFTPPDAGTFFFHTHCNTAEQLGRGLAGVLVVEGDEETPYDAERLVVLRDWSLAEQGGFGPFVTSEAARAGTFGNVRSANGETNPSIPVPAGADVRLRILNIDRTRIMQIGVEGAEVAVIPVDGNPLPPLPLKAWSIGPANRIDLVMRSPAAGGVATLFDYFAPEPVPLARFASKGEAVRSAAFQPAPLRPNPIPEPDIAGAERLAFAFSTTPAGHAQAASVPADTSPGARLDGLCSAAKTFWAINNAAWPAGDHARLPPPLATLIRGKSYVVELKNVTPRMHPIHFHGHTFKLLKSNKRDMPVHHADTVLLQPNERVEAAFVADNPGDWMFHCHIIEHQETGMMGYLRVV